MSLRSFVRSSGYARTRIITAASHLRIQLRRAPRTDARQKRRTSKFFFTPDQQAAILHFLANVPRGVRLLGVDKAKTRKGVWGIGRKPDKCHECGKSDRPHFARGFCKRCYTWVIKARKKSPWTITSTEPPP